MDLLLAILFSLLAVLLALPLLVDWRPASPSLPPPQPRGYRLAAEEEPALPLGPDPSRPMPPPLPPPRHPPRTIHE